MKKRGGRKPHVCVKAGAAVGVEPCKHKHQDLRTWLLGLQLWSLAPRLSLTESRGMRRRAGRGDSLRAAISECRGLCTHPKEPTGTWGATPHLPPFFCDPTLLAGEA